MESKPSQNCLDDERKALLMLASAFMITVQVVDSSKERSFKKPANSQERSSTLQLGASNFDKRFNDNDVEDGKTAYPKNVTAENPSKAKERLHPKNRIQRNVDTERCLNRTYGNNCTMPCPLNCQGDCKRSTGFCSGCKDKGHYGNRCEMICVQCNNLYCTFFNESCREGVNMTYFNLHSSTDRAVTVQETSGYTSGQITLVCVLIAIIIVLIVLPCFRKWRHLYQKCSEKGTSLV